jgi:hypothetical protein
MDTGQGRSARRAVSRSTSRHASRRDPSIRHDTTLTRESVHLPRPSGEPRRRTASVHDERLRFRHWNEGRTPYEQHYARPTTIASTALTGAAA